MGNVISFKTKKILSTKSINKIVEQGLIDQSKPQSTIAEGPEDIPDGSIMVEGLSGDMYAITEQVIDRIVYGNIDITEIHGYKDFLPKIIYDWFYSIPYE